MEETNYALGSRTDQMKVIRLVLLLPAATFLQVECKQCSQSIRCSHSLDTIEQEGQCEGNTGPAGDKHGSIIVCEIRRFAIWTVDEHLDLPAPLSNFTQSLGEATVDVDKKHELLPIGFGLIRWVLLGYRTNVSPSFITGGINAGDGEGMSFERDGGNAGHYQVSGLAGRPVEMSGPA